MEAKQLTRTLKIAIHEALANLHTATVARVQAVSATTIDVQPVINRNVNGQSVQLPVFTKVPPVFMQGGGSYTAHPIAPGDYCLLILTERCFDRWYDGQDFRRPAEYRMHDYSDGFAVIGVNPMALAITIPDVITHIGDTYQEGDYEHLGNRTQTGDYTQTGTRTQTGNETVTGNSVINGNETVTGLLAAGAFAGLAGGPMISDVPFQTTKNVEAASYSVGGQAGASGTFTTNDSKTVTVVNGLIVGIT
jgi:hypothetical protein